MGIFCHAKLDYFYGAIYSTKFTTTLAGSAIFLKANVRANVRRGPNTMKICGRVWGLFQGSRPKKAGFFQTAPCYVYTVWKFHDFSIT